MSIETSTTVPVWRGKKENAGLLYREAKHPSKIVPHRPLPAHLEQKVTPLEDKSVDEKGGQKGKVYSFEDWQAMCPEEVALRTVARVIGEDALSAALSEDANESPANNLMCSIVARLVGLSTFYVKTNPRTGEFNHAPFGVVNDFYEAALRSGDPLMHLDQVLRFHENPSTARSTEADIE